ncbi:putative thioredoxin protein [Paramyrothecium foliicola]|nr:putative thioredoxin protein [Paramyrothecium foliicola]
MPVHNIETRPPVPILSHPVCVANAFSSPHSIDDFKKVLSDNETVIIDWFATWCGPCKAIAPVIAKQSNEEQFKDIYFGKVDVDVLGELSAEYGIRAMPTLQLFKKGEKVEELVGPNPNTLNNFLAKGL